MTKLSIIIVNYKGFPHIWNCLNSIRMQTYKNYEIIVVDNGSDDRELKFIKKEFSLIKIIKNKINSFAKANNIGIKKAKGELILCLNNDVVLEKNFLSTIVKDMKKSPGAGMLAPQLYKSQNIFSYVVSFSKIDTYGIKMSASGMGKDITNKNERWKTICPCGACAVYKREALEDIKLNGEYFDEDFKFYCEDLDLGLRLQGRGWNVIQSNAIAYHMHSESMKKQNTYFQLQGHRNNILTIIKNYPNLLWHSPSIIFWQLASIGYWCIKLKPITILRLKLEALLLLPKMLKKRKLIQKRRTQPKWDFDCMLENKFLDLLCIELETPLP